LLLAPTVLSAVPGHVSALMRIRIVQRPGLASIDGIRLDRFEVGRDYDVGHCVAALLLAEGWAEPAPLPPDLPPPRRERAPLRFEPAPVLFKPPAASTDPANLIREKQSPYLRPTRRDLAADRAFRSSRKRR
jgi:hypothetical protein